MPWLGLTLELDPAAAEAFSEALLEAGAQSVSLDNLEAPRPMLHAVLGRDVDAPALVRRVSASLNLAAPHFTTREIAD